jgi:hypothetical protein
MALMQIMTDEMEESNGSAVRGWSEFQRAECLLSGVAWDSISNHMTLLPPCQGSAFGWGLITRRAGKFVPHSRFTYISEPCRRLFAWSVMSPRRANCPASLALGYRIVSGTSKTLNYSPALTLSAQRTRAFFIHHMYFCYQHGDCSKRLGTAYWAPQ